MADLMAIVGRACQRPRDKPIVFNAAAPSNGVEASAAALTRRSFVTSIVSDQAVDLAAATPSGMIRDAYRSAVAV